MAEDPSVVTFWARAPRAPSTTPLSRPTRSTALGITLLLLAEAAGVLAEEPTPETRRVIEEIVVTATRRAENLQDVPVAVTAISGDALARRQMRGLDDIQHAVPGFTYNHQVGTGQPTVRGVGSDIVTLAGEPGVAVYLDDVYVGRAFLTHGAFTDIERVEVLRGPQGTLYGRNTSGGAVRFITRRPSDELDVAGSLQLGSFGQKIGQLSVGGPIVDGLLNGRAFVYGAERDGWLRNLTTGSLLRGHESLSTRVSADVFPLDWLSLRFTGHFQDQHDSEPVWQALGPTVGTAPSDTIALPILAPADQFLGELERTAGPIFGPLREALAEEAALGRSTDDPRKTYLDRDSEEKRQVFGGSMTAEAELGFASSKLVVAGLSSDRLWRHDIDGGEVDFLRADPSTAGGDQWSVELQMTSLTGGAFDWIAGVFYYTEDADESFDVAIGAPPVAIPADPLPDELVRRDDAFASLFFQKTQVTRSVAGFANVDWPVLSWATLRGGGRLTRDEKTTDVLVISPGSRDECTLNGTWERFTGRLGADVRPFEPVLAYASFSQGFKAGGFNSSRCNNRFEPEHVDAYEVGVKSDWLDGRLRANAASFFYTFDEIQVQQIEGVSLTIVNAAEAEIKGFELELSALPLPALSIDFVASWLDASYLEFLSDDPFTPLEGEVDLSGNRLNRSPEWTTSLGVAYELEPFGLGLLTPRVDWIYTGEQFFTQFNRHPAAREAHHLFHAYLGFDLPDWNLGFQVFGKNLTDEVVVEWAVESQPSGGTVGGYTLPRTFGVEISARL